MPRFDLADEAADGGCRGLKENGDFSSPLALSFPKVDRRVFLKDIGACRELLVDDLRRDGFGGLLVGEDRVYDAVQIRKQGGTLGHLPDSESLKTRLPTDRFCPWYFPRYGLRAS